MFATRISKEKEVMLGMESSRGRDAIKSLTPTLLHTDYISLH